MWKSCVVMALVDYEAALCYNGVAKGTAPMGLAGCRESYLDKTPGGGSV